MVWTSFKIELYVFLDQRSLKWEVSVFVWQQEVFVIGVWKRGQRDWEGQSAAKLLHDLKRSYQELEQPVKESARLQAKVVTLQKLDWVSIECG